MFETPPHGRFACARDVPPRMVVYDFDRTLSKDHVFFSLEELKERNGEATQLKVLERMPRDQLEENVKGWFDGNDRIQRLRSHLQMIINNGAEPIIISNGYSDVIKLCLEVTGLMQYFNAASVYGWDHSERGGGPKADLIMKLMLCRQLTYPEVLFLDDDCKNISDAERVCLVRQIQEESGMLLDDMEWVEGRFRTQ